MRSRALIALVAALACGALLWLAVAGPEGAAGVAAAPEPSVAARPGVVPAPAGPVEATGPASGRAAAGAAPGSPAAATDAGAGEVREPRGTELALLHTATPLGTLEVLVLEGTRPLPGVRVTAHGLLSGGAPEDPREVLAHGLDGVTDAKGVARFVGVSPDSYTARALAPGRAVLEARVVHARDRSRRVLLVYGQGAVRGHVFDSDGAPVEGCHLAVGGQQELVDGQWTHALCTTDRAGAYRVEGLLSSEALWVTRICGDEKESVSTRLAPGEEKVVDFGVRGGAPRWTGTVRDSSGAAVELRGELTTLRQGDQRRDRFTYGADGRFEVSLAPGTYSIGAWGWAGAFVVDEVVVPPGGLHRDVVLPGARLEVELVYAGRAAPTRSLDGVSVWLRKTPAGQGHRAELGTGDRRGFRCVPPGDYWLTAGPLSLVGPDPLPVTVREGATVQHVRLAVTD